MAGSDAAAGSEGSGEEEDVWEEEEGDAYEELPPAWVPLSKRPEWADVVPIPQVTAQARSERKCSLALSRPIRSHCTCNATYLRKQSTWALSPVTSQDDGPAAVVKIEYDEKFVVSPPLPSWRPQSA